MCSKNESIDILKEVCLLSKDIYLIKDAYLYGSYARGEATKDSDLDFLIDAPSLRGLFALGSLYSDLESAFSKELDLITKKSLKHNMDVGFKSNLEREQVLLYEYAV